MTSPTQRAANALERLARAGMVCLFDAPRRVISSPSPPSLPSPIPSPPAALPQPRAVEANTERPLRYVPARQLPPDGPAIPPTPARTARRLSSCAREEFAIAFKHRNGLAGRPKPQPDNFSILDLSDGLCHYPSSAQAVIAADAARTRCFTQAMYVAQARRRAADFRREVPAPVFFCGRKTDRDGTAYCAEHARICYRNA